MKNVLLFLCSIFLNFHLASSQSLSYNYDATRSIIGVLQSSESIVAQDTLKIITVQRDPEVDALVDYYQKEAPPAITLQQRASNFNPLTPELCPPMSYYTIGDVPVTRTVVEQYLGVVSPVAYKDYAGGRQMRRKSAKWLYIGLGGYLLALTSNNQGVRRFGLGTLAVGATISLVKGISGSRRVRQGVDHYNSSFVWPHQ